MGVFRPTPRFISKTIQDTVTVATEDECFYGPCWL